jgi:hypothetical protein
MVPAKREWPAMKNIMSAVGSDRDILHSRIFTLVSASECVAHERIVKIKNLWEIMLDVDLDQTAVQSQRTSNNRDGDRALMKKEPRRRQTTAGLEGDKHS